MRRGTQCCTQCNFDGQLRKKDSTPGPAEFFDLVNDEVARRLAEEPFHLPELDAVLAEEEGADGATASTAGKRIRSKRPQPEPFD